MTSESNKMEENHERDLPMMSNITDMTSESNKMEENHERDLPMMSNITDMTSESNKMEENHERDLPMMSNITDIHIFHYILQLRCIIETKQLIGSVILFRCSELMKCTKCSKPRIKYKFAKLEEDEDDGNKTNNTRSLLEHNYTNNPLNMTEMLSTHRIRLSKDHKEECDIESSVDFRLILDCCDIQIDLIEELDLQTDLIKTINDNDTFSQIKHSAISVGPLKWEQEKHSISVWKEGIKLADDFPDVIRIQYRTTPTGQSLKWTVDQDGRWCVFTHGHWINNRSLFPSQDAPTAMATWQAEIEVREHLKVVMAGDSNEITSTSEDNGWKKEYFYTKMEMPSSTLSVAIGDWEYKNIILGKHSIQERNCNIYIPSKVVMKSCRLIGAASVVNQAHPELKRYVPHCIEEVSKCLGPHPFSRLDILIVPPCFDSLGMACPSVMYLSQSLLTGDYSMCVRIAHEICHSWFGLAIGPKDWTEEWLTEGFCSYMEDIVHLKVKQEMKICDVSEAVEERQLRNSLKYKTLENELRTTNIDLQMLRPNKDISQNDKTGTSYIKDGMNPEKRFLQVHYLKGHFLLCYLEKFVGTDKFLTTMHAYVIGFHKELVSSQDVITFIFHSLPELREQGLMESKLSEDWLDKPGMPVDLKDYSIPEENTLIKNVNKQVLTFRMSYPKQGSRKRKRTPTNPLKLDDLSPLQLVYLLELLLEDDKIPPHLLTYLRKKYNLMELNADVQHRWCELVIKHKLQKFYNDLKYFLLHHQAMGVYLFGEMVLSGCKHQKKLAEECFNSLKTHMEPDPYSTVKSMIYGT